MLSSARLDAANLMVVVMEKGECGEERESGYASPYKPFWSTVLHCGAAS